MSEIACFWCEESSSSRTMLRRYRSSADPAEKCPLPFGYHNAHVLLPDLHDWPAGDTLTGRQIDVARDHPEWPRACACGYAFREDDEWQAMEERLYRRGDTGELVLGKDLPPGAMWNAHWYLDTGFVRSPDGIALCVKLPDGTDWLVDGPANNSKDLPGWTRSGTPPNVTARPSILTPGYHGFLTEGVLRSC